jgi:hypothetical protein
MANRPEKKSLLKYTKATPNNLISLMDNVIKLVKSVTISKYVIIAAMEILKIAALHSITRPHILRVFTFHFE